MDEKKIIFSKNSPQVMEEEISIKAAFQEAIQYKFIIGNDGVWSTLSDFSEKDEIKWSPKKEGKYIIMVQGKKSDSAKPFDFLAKEEFIIGKEEKVKYIRDVHIEKDEVSVGDKININVVSDVSPILFRFWKKGKQGWEAIRDYQTDGHLIYTATEIGQQEILIECKKLDSSENFDDFTTVRFKVKEQGKIEITNFKCLTEQLLINEELVFKVDSSHDEARPLLYKFLRINKEGKVMCLQDFSSRKIVSYQEKEPGEYKLLCLVKDMLSNKEYDDRALIVYNIKPYNEVTIKKFNADIKSPQLIGTEVKLMAEVVGGRELIYRYIIDGPFGEDTGFIRGKEFIWQPKQEGEYNITLFVKDISYDGEYEDKSTIQFSIEKKGEKPVRISDIIMENKKTLLVGQTSSIKVVAEGGTVLSYSFLVYKDSKELKREDYSSSNWFTFTAEEKGEYEIEVRVKDKYTSKEYDSNSFVYIKCKDYIPAEIDYVLMPNKGIFLVGDVIDLEIITQNTKSTLIKYVTKINGHIVEDTDFVGNKKLRIKPKCAGKYVFEFYGKNIKSTEEFDIKKELVINVQESTPVTGTKISLSTSEISINKEVTFSVKSQGGKEVCYEFYIMEKGSWVKAQSYSRKHYYTFMPFAKGEYRVLVFAKSFYKNVNYEDYDEISFQVK